MSTITIRCINDGLKYEVAEGARLLEIYEQIRPQLAQDVVSARVNNLARGLNFRVYNSSDVEFLDITSPSGMRTYTRTLMFIMGKAIEDLYKGCHFSVEASLGYGYFVYLLHADGKETNVSDIRHRMDEIIAKDIPFKRIVCPTEEAIKVFEQNDLHSNAQLLKSVGSLYTTYYTLDGYPDYYYSDLCPSTGWIKNYGLEAQHDGLVLRLPDPQKPDQLMPYFKQDKMLEVFREHRVWQYMGCLRTVGELNDICASGHTNDVINISEALQEKKVCHIAEDIQAKGTVRLVLIAGPSSSGKTTFSKRLCVQMMVCGMRPHPISMDEYYLPHSQTPRDADGNYDFESIDALNLPMLADHLQRLFKGEEVELPHYDFETGESKPSGTTLHLEPNEVLVMEGIHALNPRLTASIDDALKYKVFVSALTTIQLDNHNYISARDNRLLRRIVRDQKYRGSSATDTIRQWPSVAAGEKKWIFPYQEEADAMFNSALLFELAGLRVRALPLLQMVPENVPEYAEANRLIKFLSYINPIRIESLPPASLLREFLGGSSFRY